MRTKRGLKRRSSSRARLTQYPCRFDQVPRRHRSPSCQGMIGRPHHDKTIARHRSERQRGVVDGFLPQTQGRPCRQGRRSRHRRSCLRVASRRLPGAPPGSARGTAKASSWRSSGWLELSAFPAEDRRVRSTPARQVSRALCRFGLKEKTAARLAQFDATSDPIKEVGPAAGLQSVDRCAHRGRRKVQGLGGSRKVFAFSDGDKNPKLIERHIHPSQSNGICIILR
jgi:hypothetical protein